MQRSDLRQSRMQLEGETSRCRLRRAVVNNRDGYTTANCKYFKDGTASFFFFFLKDPAPPEFSPLPLPAALPISPHQESALRRPPVAREQRVAERAEYGGERGRLACRQAQRESAPPPPAAGHEPGGESGDEGD